MYCINVVPISWQRAARNRNRSYDIDTKDRVSFLLYLSQQHEGEPLFEKPVHLDVTFYMPIHKSVRDRKNYFYHYNVPVLSNLYRFLLEAMKNIVILDDRVICSLSLKKVYDNTPRTEFKITEVV